MMFLVNTKFTFCASISNQQLQPLKAELTTDGNSNLMLLYLSSYIKKSMTKVPNTEENERRDVYKNWQNQN